MSTVFALSACGGGEPETIESKQAVAAETALWTSPTAWTTIATEGRSFSVSGTVTVRYGADSRWVSKSVTGSGNCTNTFFGKDPAYGVVKSCQVGDSASAPAPAPAPAPATTSSWSTIAGEGDPFSHTTDHDAGSHRRLIQGCRCRRPQNAPDQNIVRASIRARSAASSRRMRRCRAPSKRSLPDSKTPSSQSQP